MTPPATASHSPAKSPADDGRLPAVLNFSNQTAPHACAGAKIYPQGITDSSPGLPGALAPRANPGARVHPKTTLKRSRRDFHNATTDYDYAAANPLAKTTPPGNRSAIPSRRDDRW